MEIAAESSISTYFYCISIEIQLVKTTKDIYYHFLKNNWGLNLNYFLVLGSSYFILFLGFQQQYFFFLYMQVHAVPDLVLARRIIHLPNLSSFPQLHLHRIVVY